MTRRLAVAVCGSGAVQPDDPRWALSEAMGRALIDARYRLVCGGRSGVTEAAAKGARSSVVWREGDVVGLLPSLDPEEANPWIDVAIPTGLGHLRNGLIVASSAVVAIGGGAGTLSEMALAWIYDRPILAFRVDGWSGRLADQRLDERVRFADRPDDRVYGVNTPAEAIAMLDALLK